MKKEGKGFSAAVWSAVALGAVGIGVIVAFIAGYFLGHFTGHENTTTVSVTAAAASEEATGTSEEVSSVTESWTLPNVNVQNTRAIESEITPENVSQLKVAWTVGLKGVGTFGTYASTPVFSPDGKTVYLQTLANDVFAVDVESGKILWEYDVPPSATNNEGPNGVAYYEGDLYGETNTTAFALDAETGEKVWETSQLAEKEGQGFNIQPQPYEGKIFLSTSGQLNGGVAYALDAKSGEVLREFQETKEPKDRKAGGPLGTGGAWNSPAIGPEGEVIYAVANPYRSIEQAIKEPTELLYNNSTVALDQESGELKWHFQAIPNDFHDWDMQDSPIYTEAGGSPVVIDAGKMGYVYEIDATSGKLIWKTPVGEHNGKDNDAVLAMEGKLKKPKLPYIYLPGLYGGVETNMASAEGVVFAAVNDLPAEFKKYNEPIASPTKSFTKGTGEMVALDLETGKILWDTKLPDTPYGAATYSNGLVFTTTFNGEVLAFDAKTGKQVWNAKLPAGTNSPIAIVGDTLVTAGGYPLSGSQKPAIVAFKLGASGTPGEETLVASGGGAIGGSEEEAEPKGGEEGEAAKPESSGESAESEGSGESASAAAGENVFETNCATCHTLAAAGSSGTVGPNLDELMPSEELVVHQVTNGGGGMPAFGGTLSKTEIESVAKFVSSVAGKPLSPEQKKKAEEHASSGGP